MAEQKRLTARDPGGNAYILECDGCGGNAGYCRCVHFDEVCEKLARYEEQAEQAEKLLAESETARAELGKRLAAAQIRDLLKAENEGLLMMLPCGTDANLVRDGHTYKGDHWNHTLTAFRDAPENKSGKQVALFSIKEAEAALAQKGGSND